MPGNSIRELIVQHAKWTNKIRNDRVTIMTVEILKIFVNLFFAIINTDLACYLILNYENLHCTNSVICILIQVAFNVNNNNKNKINKNN